MKHKAMIHKKYMFMANQQFYCIIVHKTVEAA